MRSAVEDIFHKVADLSEETRAQYFLQHAIDPDTVREVEELLLFDQGFSSPIEGAISHAVERALEGIDPRHIQCGPYRLTNLLGRGGMGTIYLAQRVDGEVTQQVAVKLLRPGADDPAFRQRFLSERQILATLSHPNVARLLDAGHRDDGQPYMVMEFIEGKAIDVYTSGIGLRAQIALFVKVCAAVGYLHRNIVVHRDLKPSNIMVTSDGEPKLLDFGIAKILDLSTDTTVTGLRMLTPDYASPEQASGGPITTATDIYSLGAVLHKLLTGVSPRQLERDSKERPAPPATQSLKLAPGLQGDLAIILKKALRLEPQERYATAEQLADDLENYLESRPIRARRGDVWYRTRKFLRRFWLPVAATVLALAGSVSGLLVVNQERAVAERRFTQLRQLSNQVLDLDGSIRYLSASVQVRRQLVAVSSQYLEGLSKEVGGNADLALEVAYGYQRLARVQGVNTEFNLGDSASADQSLKKAEALLEPVLASHPDNRPVLYRAAGIAHDRMSIARGEDRHADILAHAHKSVEYLEKLLPPGDDRRSGHAASAPKRDTFPSERSNIAQLYRNIATVYGGVGSYADAVVYARRAVALAQSIGSAAFTSGSLRVLADALRNQGELDGALTAIRQARAISLQSTDSKEADRLFSDYGPALQEGLILGEADSVNLGRPDEAIQDLQKALDIAEASARQDANDSASRTRVGVAAWALGDVLRDRDPKRSLSVYELGIKRLAEARGQAEADRYRTILLIGSSYPLRRLQRPAEAKARLDAALAILQASKDYPAERIPLDSPQQAISAGLADHEAEIGNPRRALELYDELLQRVQKSSPEAESKLPQAVRLTQLYTAAAKLNRRLGRNSAAADLEMRCRELWRHWDARLPNNAFVRRQLNAVL